MEKTNVFTNYLAYTGDTESPIIYHRWCYISCLGAILGRRVWINHGHFRVFPNLFVQLLGEPAARKSTSIKIAKKLLASAGYDKFGADKTTKEKFLLDLEGITEEFGEEGTKTSKPKYDASTSDNLWGDTIDSDPKEVFIVADEFNEFAGPGNLDFFTTLGNLWDFDSPDVPFTQRLKNSKSVSIYQPTISILSGNTPELFARAFPPEAIGSGFLSRLLLIHGERTGKKITFPAPPDKELGLSLQVFLRKLLTVSPGALELEPAARDLLDSIYKTDHLLEDIRFKAYVNRSFTQLLKLCCILAVASFSSTVTAEIVIHANTILSHAEILMPKAMGEFGKNKNSDVANRIMNILDQATKPVSTREIWGAIGGPSVLGKERELIELLTGLLTADKIQIVKIGATSNQGFLPKKKPVKTLKHVDWSFLTKEEQDIL